MININRGKSSSPNRLKRNGSERSTNNPNPSTIYATSSYNPSLIKEIK